MTCEVMYDEIDTVLQALANKPLDQIRAEVTKILGRLHPDDIRQHRAALIKSGIPEHLIERDLEIAQWCTDFAARNRLEARPVRPALTAG